MKTHRAQTQNLRRVGDALSCPTWDNAVCNTDLYSKGYWLASFFPEENTEAQAEGPPPVPLSPYTLSS